MVWFDVVWSVSVSLESLQSLGNSRRNAGRGRGLAP